MRKIVQIAAVPETDGSEGGVYGLCDDGTLWVLCHDQPGGYGTKWDRMPDIPQDELAQNGEAG